MYSKTKELIDVCKSFIGHFVQVNANFMGRSIPISNGNAVGDILEDVFYPIFKKELDFEEGPKQASPDFYGDSSKEFKFEMKVFTKSPGFDIANYASYVDQLSKENGVVDKLFKTKYLIFEYFIQEDKIYIKNFHYLNVWQLPLYTGKHPISIQEKRGQVYNLRSGSVTTWYNSEKTPNLFIDSIVKLIKNYPGVADRDVKITKIHEQFTKYETSILI
jgi:hypothetical protein